MTYLISCKSKQNEIKLEPSASIGTAIDNNLLLIMTANFFVLHSLKLISYFLI